MKLHLVFVVIFAVTFTGLVTASPQDKVPPLGIAKGAFEYAEVRDLEGEEDATPEAITGDTDETTEDTEITSPEPDHTTHKPKNKLNGGQIAGIVIGCVAGVALIGGGIFFMKKKEMACFG